MEVRRADIATAVDQVNDGSGVILLTDLFGGTPSNLAISLLKAGEIEVIAGINLPMLIRLESARKSMTVQKAVAAARERSEEHTSELQSLMRISYAVFCLIKKKRKQKKQHNIQRLKVLNTTHERNPTTTRKEHKTRQT